MEVIVGVPPLPNLASRVEVGQRVSRVFEGVFSPFKESGFPNALKLQPHQQRADGDGGTAANLDSYVTLTPMVIVVGCLHRLLETFTS